MLRAADRTWRRNVAHAVENYDALSDTSLSFRVCNGDVLSVSATISDDYAEARPRPARAVMYIDRYPDRYTHRYIGRYTGQHAGHNAGRVADRYVGGFAGRPVPRLRPVTYRYMPSHTITYR